MFSFKKISIFCFFVIACCALMPAQATTYKVSACGGCASPNSDPDAVGFYNAVAKFTNWTKNYYDKYASCSEVHYKSATYSGSENSKIDTSHIHYHVSHGGAHNDSTNGSVNITAIVFAAILDDPKYLDAGEAASAWGNNTLDWIAFRCCKLLDDTSWSYWSETMNGLHLILGFKTNSNADDEFGSTWAGKMHRVTGGQGPIYFIIPAQTIAQAWFSTVDISQPTDVTARVIAETKGCYGDYLHGSGTVSSDPTADNEKFHWEHTANPPFQLANENSINHVAKQAVMPPTITMTSVRQIGSAFGFGAQDDVIEMEDTYMMTRPDDENPDPDNPVHVLYVYKNSGMYYYQDLSRLWKINHSNPVIPGIYPEANAAQRAYTFLTDSSHINLYPNDVDTYSVDADQIIEKNIATSAATVHPVYRCVAYSRSLEADTGVPVSVVGPGAKLKVYIDEDGTIMGAMGNWRQVQQSGTVNIMTKEAAWNLFVQNGQEASAAPIYLEYDSVQTDLNTATIGYYESSPTKSQTELIPVWIYNVNYYQDSNLVLTAHTYIPAEI